MQPFPRLGRHVSRVLPPGFFTLQLLDSFLLLDSLFPEGANFRPLIHIVPQRVAKSEHQRRQDQSQERGPAGELSSPRCPHARESF